MLKWWIDKPIVLGTSNPTDSDLAGLAQDGFKTIVCLLDFEEQSPRYLPAALEPLGWEFWHIRLRDRHAPSVTQLRQFLLVVNHLEDGGKLVVHCAGGTGRTGTFGAAYWIAKGLTPAGAVSKMRRVRPEAIDTLEQCAVLDELSQSIERSPVGERE